MAEENTRKQGGADGPLEEFLAAAESFVKNISAAMVRSAGDNEDALLLDGTGQVVVAQFGRLTEEVRTSYRGANVAARREADRFLAVQQGVMLAQVGEQTARTALERGVGRNFFAWISQYLEEIKKLIEFILDLIFGFVPGWVSDLILLIDELWDMISSLLGGIFGFNAREIADEISARAVNTRNELAAQARLKTARAFAGKAENGD